MLIHVLLTLVPFLVGLLLDVDKTSIRATTTPWLSYISDRVASVVPQRVVYIEVPPRVEIPVPVITPANLSTYDLVGALSRNVVRDASFALSSLYCQCSWVQILLSVTVIGLALIYLANRIGRPMQATFPPMFNVLNVIKSNKRARHDEQPTGPEKRRAGQDTAQATPQPTTAMPDLRPASYTPGDDIEEWLHFFQQYANQYEQRSWATLMLLTLDKSCHQQAKLSYRDSYDELTNKLLKAFSKQEPKESNQTLKACGDHLEEFVQRHRRDDETAVQFLSALEELGAQALPTMSDEMREKHVKSHFMKGLNNDDLKSDILRTMAQTDEHSITVKRLSEIVGNYEEWLYHKNGHFSTTKSSKSSTRSSSSSQSSTRSNKGTKSIEKTFNINRDHLRKSNSSENMQRYLDDTHRELLQPKLAT